jgi:Holliday junction DNA helicase RuvA
VVAINEIIPYNLYIMIAFISGTIIEKFAGSAILDVQGVGYEVTLTAIDFGAYNLGDEVRIHTYHHIREQSEELFGFSSLAGKKLFELLITVQGIGPKAAMSILSLASPEEVRNAIANADDKFIAGANGVGKKSAERVIVDLKDKVGLPAYYGRKAAAQTEMPTADEALEALMALGYTLKDATVALVNVDNSLSVEERIRQALKR